MKTLLYTLALIAAPLATVTAVAAPVEAVDVQKVEAAFAELEQLQVKMVEILETAKDKESADAAAEELFLIIGRVKELQYDARQINHCDAATQQRLVKSLIQNALAIDARKKAVGKSLVQNGFYGSEDLKDAVRAML